MQFGICMGPGCNTCMPPLHPSGTYGVFLPRWQPATVIQGPAPATAIVLLFSFLLHRKLRALQAAVRSMSNRSSPSSSPSSGSASHRSSTPPPAVPTGPGGRTAGRRGRFLRPADFFSKNKNANRWQLYIFLVIITAYAVRGRYRELQGAHSVERPSKTENERDAGYRDTEVQKRTNT